MLASSKQALYAFYTFFNGIQYTLEHSDKWNAVEMKLS